MNGGCFRYHTGEIVRVGDRVISEGRRYGVVQWISLPGSREAEAECAPEGTVTIAENVNGIMSLAAHYLAAEGNNVAWRTTLFLRRGSVIRTPYGSGTVPWPYECGLYGGGLAPGCEEDNATQRLDG